MPFEIKFSDEAQAQIEEMMRQAEEAGRGPEAMGDLLRVLSAISANPMNPNLPPGAHITAVVQCEYCLHPTEEFYNPHVCWDGAADDSPQRRLSWPRMPESVEERWMP